MTDDDDRWTKPIAYPRSCIRGVRENFHSATSNSFIVPKDLGFNGKLIVRKFLVNEFEFRGLGCTCPYHLYNAYETC